MIWKRIIMSVLFIGLVIASIMIGSFADMNLATLRAGDENAWLVFWHSRVPRTAAIVLSAAGLSVGGLIMQAISRNKFMSPGTSGATDAAALGLLLAFIYLPTNVAITIGRLVIPAGVVQTALAFVFALVATIIFVMIINKLKIREVVYIPLLGMMYGGMIAAVSSAIAFHHEAIQMLNAFNLASFARLGHFEMIYIVTIPLIFVVFYATKFSIIGLGADFAKNLGVHYDRVVFLGLCIISLISAAVFVSVGPLPFVGLIIPNMATTIYGDNLKKSVIDLMMFGAVFVLFCDILSRLIIWPFEMNVSVTVSLLGGAIFMVYLIRGMSSGRVRQSKTA
ncbi:MAG: iron chelate uptake ABC transporter family permease subunit [Defluviitaleaceae bacterium]|nr:iron chelate uptake ABC transporter family permease subunit [Defluviitaleaceae bacterium]